MSLLAGASWYNVHCFAEFAEDGFRVGAVVHYGDSHPAWFGTSWHSLEPQQRSKPRLIRHVKNPSIGTFINNAMRQHTGGMHMAERIARQLLALVGALLMAGMLW